MSTNYIGMSIGGPMVLLPGADTPLQQAGAEASSALDSRQRAIVIGDPVPIVFGKRVQRTTYKWSGDTATAITYTVGGVFVSPGATEGRFSNDATTNELSVKFHLVLSQGDMPQLQLRDVFQRACRVGTWKQTYDRRAGTWTPGNFITAVAGKELWNCPIFCGTSGYYDDLTTLSYENTHADGDQTWDRQVHCFVREGIIVDRLIEGTAGSSNNVCDLAIYLIKQSSRFPDDLIDTATFTTAANFTETQQLYYNGEFKDSQNLEDWLQRISTYFLMRVSDKNGKKAFRPRVPITDAYAIDTGVVTPVFTFSEDHLLPDGFEIEWIPYADRRPTIMQMLWRQQPEDDIGIVRSSLVNIVNKFDDLPIEQHDMSAFCASELHAVKAGTYLAAKRAFVSHTLRVRVKPDAYNSTLTLGDVVRVRLQRETDPDAVSWHDYFYEVERINKTFSGAVELDLIHYPIDANGRSVLALYVAAAQIKGYEYPTGRSTFTCDTPGRDENETLLDDDGGDLPGLPDPDTDWTPVDPAGDPTDPSWPADSPTWPSDQPDPNEPDAPTVPDPEWPDGTDDPDDPNNEAGRDSNVGGGGSGGVPTQPNPADPIDSVPDSGAGGGGTIGGLPSDRPLLPGDTLTYTPPCCPAEVLMYAIDFDTGVRLQEAPVAVGTAIVGDCEVRFEILNEYLFDSGTAFEFTHRCVDPGSPDGYGDELPGGTTPKVAPCGTARTYSNDSTELETYSVFASGFSTSLASISGISIYIKYDTEFCAGEGQFRLWYRGQSIVGGQIVTNEAAIHNFCYGAYDEAVVMAGLQVYKDGSLLGSELCDSLLNDPGLNEAPADEYRISTSIYEIGFTTTEANPWFVIGSTNNGCGENTIRTLTYVTGEPNVSTSSWGVCASPSFSAPGQYYGTLYRRRPGTVGPGLINFDPVRDLYFP